MSFTLQFNRVFMIKCIVRPLHKEESCLLIGFEYEPLTIKQDGDKVIFEQSAPLSGWTYDLLEQICSTFTSNEYSLDAYLKSNHWIGSTEI